uniref:hypothetical protein n=1 Tax=Agathobacter sp. TaxID=2021311 RepID=UPI004056B6CB
MKNTILGIVGTWIAIYTIAIAMEVYNTQVRENQLDNAISHIVQEVLKTHYQGSNAQAKADLQERIKDGLHAGAEPEIEILALDMEKGIISVTVTERYRQANGAVRAVSASKTAIMERAGLEE